MQRPTPITQLFLATVAAAALWAGGAHAFSSGGSNSHERARLLQQGRLDELQILEHRERRLRFQKQRQENREQDRRSITVMPEPLPIPRMRRNCQAQVFGSPWLTGCR